MSDVPDVAKPDLRAPFPYFGGKKRVAQVVWDRFGDGQGERGARTHLV